MCTCSILNNEVFIYSFLIFLIQSLRYSAKLNFSRLTMQMRDAERHFPVVLRLLLEHLKNDCLIIHDQMRTFKFLLRN